MSKYLKLTDGNFFVTFYPVSDDDFRLVLHVSSSNPKFDSHFVLCKHELFSRLSQLFPILGYAKQD